MAKKKFVLRLDDNVYFAVEKWAQDEFRSANGQIEWILTSMLKKENRLKNSQKESKSEDNKL